MTEAMSRHEIEDVLTSIRRLVSQDPQDKRPRQGTTPPEPARVEKLVLTSALRIDGGADGPPQDDLPPQGAALQDVAPICTDAAADQAPVASSLLSRIQNAGSARASEPAARTVPGAEPVLAVGDVPSGHISPVADDVPRPPQAEIPAQEPLETVEDAALEATLSRLEAMLAETPAASQSATHHEPAQPDSALDQVIDERMLYQLVAQIVRQELQGELGEKITRNIRKLVRSEVARELALRKL